MSANFADSDFKYLKKKLFKLSMILIIVGALNWLLIGAFNFNLVATLFGKSVIARTIYILVGLSGVAIMFDRDTYLPFLGETVLPCSLLPDRVPPGATKEIHVTIQPKAKVLYWAAEPRLESLKQINDWRAAYQEFQNAGVTTADETGVAILKVRSPQAYTVPFKGRLEPHIHYRVCGDGGMLGRVNTLFLSKTESPEGFSDY